MEAASLTNRNRCRMQVGPGFNFPAEVRSANFKSCRVSKQLDPNVPYNAAKGPVLHINYSSKRLLVGSLIGYVPLLPLVPPEPWVTVINFILTREAYARSSR